MKLLLVRTDGYCSPRHSMQLNSRNEGWNAFDDVASTIDRHVLGCELAEETRVPNAFDDLASTIHQSLPLG